MKIYQWRSAAHKLITVHPILKVHRVIHFLRPLLPSSPPEFPCSLITRGQKTFLVYLCSSSETAGCCCIYSLSVKSECRGWKVTPMTDLNLNRALCSRSDLHRVHLQPNNLIILFSQYMFFLLVPLHRESC